MTEAALYDIWPARFVIVGAPCSYKNSKRAVRMGKRFALLPSKSAERWMKAALEQLESQWAYGPIPKSVRVNAKILSYLPTRRLTDLDNLLGGPGDALQRAGILEDDVSICSFDGSRRLYDKERPRVVIELTPAA